MGIFRKGENWFIDYRANGRRVREKIGQNRKLAESVYSKRKLDLAENKFLDVRKVSRETFRTFAERYLEWVQGRIQTVEEDRRYIKRLNHTFGNMRLEEIDVAQAEAFMSHRLGEPKHHPFTGRGASDLSADALAARIKSWYATNTKTISKAYVNREVSCLRKILNKAVAWKVIPANPLAGIKLYDEREFIRKRYLKPDDIPILLECCNASLRDIVTFALYTGRRRGEILGMTWRDVDLQNSYVFFPKTKKKEPEQVAIPPRARDLLKRLAANSRGEYVFRKRRGEGPITEISQQFTQACSRAGIKDFRFHDLRHTAVSYMVMNGIDLKTIADMVGHTTTEMVDKRYGHLSPNHKRAATEIFGSAMDQLCGYKAVKP